MEAENFLFIGFAITNILAIFVLIKDLEIGWLMIITSWLVFIAGMLVGIMRYIER